jgi:uncharacterized membrane protein YfcA
LFFIVAFISEIIGAIAGFGSSTIFLPLALFFVDFETALILVAVVLMVSVTVINDVIKQIGKIVLLPTGVQLFRSLQWFIL